MSLIYLLEFLKLNGFPLVVEESIPCHQCEKSYFSFVFVT